jgi:two-component system response regulator HydG
MLVLSPGDVITIDDIPSEIKAAASQPPKAEKPCLPVADTVSSSNPVSLEDTKKAKILEAISAAGGNKSKAAENLGISRRTLHRKLKEWGMS